MKSLVIKSSLALALTLGANELFAAESESMMNLQTDMGMLLLHSTITLLLLVIFLVLAGVVKNMSSNKRLSDLIKANRAAKVMLIGFFLSIGGTAMAQNATSAESLPFVMSDSLLWTFITVDVLLVSLILYEISLIKKIFRMAAPPSEAEAVEENDWAVAGIKLTDNVPLEKEGDVMLDHNYDGIRELDNNLPPWWLYGFYVSIVFAVVYVIYFHFAGGLSQAEEYNQEMAQAEKEVAAYLSSLSNLVDESNVTLLTAESDLASGKEIYNTNCASCHGMNGEGGVGPTFADRYWKHGGGIKNVFSTIKYGVVEKGMISWESSLSPGEMQKVASYLLTFEGTKPPGMKEPEGELWEESAAETPAPAEADSSDENSEEPKEAEASSEEEVAQL